MCDDGFCSVALQQKIPDEPKLFALIHELKHHYCDRAALGSGVIHCGDYDRNELIEKGAEVFAAEFIYPEASLQRISGTLPPQHSSPPMSWTSSVHAKRR